MSRKAFTLIELLVVIAIIAILAAILFPVFAQAKLAAKKTVDLSNMKNMALGVNLYAGDYDDHLCNTSWEQAALGSAEATTFPQTANPANPAGTYQIHWSFLIQPYIKSMDIFLNPADPNPFPTDNVCANPSDVGKLTGGLMTCDWAAQKSSYIPIYNAMPAHDWNVVSMGQFSAPANQIVIATHRNDGTASNGHKGTSGFYPSQPCSAWSIVPIPAGAAAPNTYSYFTAAYANAKLAAAKIPNFAANASSFKKYDILRVNFDLYTNGANYSYADGHAKYQSVAKTLDPNSYQYGDSWYPQSAGWNASPCP